MTRKTEIDGANPAFPSSSLTPRIDPNLGFNGMSLPPPVGAGRMWLAGTFHAAMLANPAIHPDAAEPADLAREALRHADSLIAENKR